MANLSKAYQVLSKALDRLGRMGVTDVHARLAARILPPEKCGAEERALELAQLAIGELHQRGLEVVAGSLALELGVEPLDPSRLAGSTVVDDGFLSPPPIAGVIRKAILPDVPPAPATPEVPVPPVEHEVRFGEGLDAGVKVGLDLGKGSDHCEPTPAWSAEQEREYQRELELERLAKEAQQPLPVVPPPTMEELDAEALRREEARKGGETPDAPVAT